MLSIGCAENLEMGVSEREKSKVTSKFFAWLGGGTIKNGTERVSWGEGRNGIDLPFKLEISISHLIKDARSLIAYESLAQVRRHQGWRKMLWINSEEIIVTPRVRMRPSGEQGWMEAPALPWGTEMAIQRSAWRAGWERRAPWDWEASGEDKARRVVSSSLPEERMVFRKEGRAQLCLCYREVERKEDSEVICRRTAR